MLRDLRTQLLGKAEVQSRLCFSASVWYSAIFFFLYYIQDEHGRSCLCNIVHSLASYQSNLRV